MPDIIRLLPDNIANQIAAGEVIQRPASAVKELLENAVDAGADQIKLIVADAGKELVQVIDNGKGMSETDARMAFERHATSKISTIDDLFHIRTMGFRGEALASIAAVAQVELKTKRKEDDAGVCIVIENSTVLQQEPVAFNNGTSIAMKNLFFNVPARRNFLKSNAAELRHIVDEFIRVGMAFPDVFFSMVSNGQEMFHLEKGTLKQRIIQLLGSNYQSKLVSVNEKTDYLTISGFVGKPETAKKTRGDQYFFVNNRFIKSAYLNHAVMSAFSELISKDSFPMYTLFIDLDPTQLDINVHPTKQEIKFEDEKIVYAFIQSVVKHALAQFSVSPTLDFELDPTIQQLDAVSKPVTDATISSAKSSQLFNQFTGKNQAHLIERKSDLKHWREVYAPISSVEQPDSIPDTLLSAIEQKEVLPGAVMQLHNSFIVVQNEEGYWLIQQQNAHERILFERFQKALNDKPIACQQSMFPATINCTPTDAVILQELLPYLLQLGFQIEPFGNTTFIIRGTPADLTDTNDNETIEKLLEQYKHFSMDLTFTAREKLLRSMALQQAVRSNVPLTETEMKSLVHNLMQCDVPNATPNGKPTFIRFRKDDLNKMFGR